MAQKLEYNKDKEKKKKLFSYSTNIDQLVVHAN